MVSTYALTDYDVYNEGEFDDYRPSFRRNIVRRSVPPRRYTTKKSGRYRVTGIPKRIRYPRVARKVVKRKRVVYKPPIRQLKVSRKIPINVLHSKSLLKRKQYPRIVRRVTKKKYPTYRPILKRSKTSSKISINILHSRRLPKRKRYPRTVRGVFRNPNSAYRPVIKRRKISPKVPANILRPIGFPKRKRYPRTVRRIVRKPNSTYRPVLKRSRVLSKTPVNILPPMRRNMVRPANKKYLIRKKTKVERASKSIIPRDHIIKTRNIALEDKTHFKKGWRFNGSG